MYLTSLRASSFVFGQTIQSLEPKLRLNEEDRVAQEEVDEVVATLHRDDIIQLCTSFYLYPPPAYESFEVIPEDELRAFAMVIFTARKA